MRQERLIRAGEMVFTPPLVDHGMVFPEDTVFLTLSRNPRDQATYEADVVRIESAREDRIDRVDADGHVVQGREAIEKTYVEHFEEPLDFLLKRFSDQITVGGRDPLRPWLPGFLSPL